jgi:hypothetical protein
LLTDFVLRMVREFQRLRHRHTMLTGAASLLDPATEFLHLDGNNDCGGKLL